jgi:tRNA-2-methylthio-N6-dimethylallyladenosine synthase
VGFPGETNEQYQRTMELIEDIQFDKVHAAAYSPRPGTIASRNMPDDVSREEKSYRLKNLEEVQTQILTEKNSRLLDETLEILVEGQSNGKWQGRTRNDKLVFFKDESGHLGDLLKVKVTRTSPWSLQGVPVDTEEVAIRGVMAGDY